MGNLCRTKLTLRQRQGLQAARSADVAISQFRFLKKLLLVHGAWSYQRISKMILCRFKVDVCIDPLLIRAVPSIVTFYKNIVLYMTQFWVSECYSIPQ